MRFRSSRSDVLSGSSGCDPFVFFMKTNLVLSGFPGGRVLHHPGNRPSPRAGRGERDGGFVVMGYQAALEISTDFSTGGVVFFTVARRRFGDVFAPAFAGSLRDSSSSEMMSSTMLQLWSSIASSAISPPQVRTDFPIALDLDHYRQATSTVLLGDR